MNVEAAYVARGSQFSWRNLLLAAALADLGILLFMALALGDALALVLAAAILVGLALLRFRVRWPGLVLLGLVFADTAIWTLPGAVANFISREPLIDLLLPAFLGTLSFLGVIASLAVYRGRQSSAEHSALALRVGQATLALLGLELAAGLLLSGGLATAASATDVTVETKNMAFSSNALTLPSGPVTVRLVNHDLWWHTFTIDELGVSLNVPMGAEEALSFSAPPGEYRFYCAIPGHAAIGMAGTLTVREPAPAP